MHKTILLAAMGLWFIKSSCGQRYDPYAEAAPCVYLRDGGELEPKIGAHLCRLPDGGYTGRAPGSGLEPVR
jgi:hypothetical protein